MTKGEKFPRIRLGNRRSARHLPLALADQHRLLPVGAVVRAALDPRPTPGWGSQLALDLAIGAGQFFIKRKSRISRLNGYTACPILLLRA